MSIMKVLLVEDSDFDADLIIAATRREDLEVVWSRADDESSFLSRLSESPDAIVTDFNLPSFSALRVLELMRQRSSGLPVLVVTGAIKDELAAECIKQGAADYLLKDRLARLPDALEKAIERFRSERRKREADQRLLAVAAGRAILNEMLLRSLSVDLSEDSLRAVLAPLFDFNALPAVMAVRMDIPGLATFRADRAELNGARTVVSPVERVLDVVDGSNIIGRIDFLLANDVVLDRETTQFLDEVFYVLSGVVKRARAEKSLRQSLAEQEELLREIHHRVKNNLAAVQSLIALEASHIGDERGREALERLETQVRSIALVHEMLYARGGFTGIDFKDYIHELKIRVIDELNCPQEELDFEANCSGLFVPLEAAVSLGILFNELFIHAASCALKRGRLEILVMATEERKNSWRITYRERPVSPMAHDDGSSCSSQLEFVQVLLPQYEGTMEVEDGGLLVHLSLLVERVSKAYS
jgi:two-component sensor histidine kinase/CheY-like chemotaxis protein